MTLEEIEESWNYLHGLTTNVMDGEEISYAYIRCDYMDFLLSEVKRLRGWEEFAAQEVRNKEYYQGLLDEIAKNFGQDAHTSDDGSIQDSPLRAKMPELVAKLSADIKRLREGIEKHKKIKEGYRIKFWVEDDELYKLLEAK